MRGTKRALGIAALTWAASAGVASAGGMNGQLVSNVDFNCYSIATGSPYVEPMISAIVGWGSTGEMPAAGETFSAQISVGLVGRSCSGASISPTVIPPLGVKIAGPVQWRYPGTSEAWQTSGVRLLTLPDGSAKLVPEANDSSLWPIANDQPPLQFLVPLVAERRLTGAGSAAGQCPNGPPCPRAEAGDYLQVQVDTSIGNPLILAPVVPLYASPPEPALTGKPTVAKSGRSVKVQAAAGAKVTARLSARGKTLAKGSATATRAGTLTVKLKPTPALKKLEGTVKAKLKLTATGTGLIKAERSVTVRVRG